MSKIKLLFAIITLTSFPAYSAEIQNIQGNAIVHDGDSFRIGNEKIRLYGIDAPELGQKCHYEKISNACGIASRDFLVKFISDNVVTCKKVDTDRYKRNVSKCFVANKDLGREMVKAGYAVTYKKYPVTSSNNQRKAKDKILDLGREKVKTGDAIEDAQYVIDYVSDQNNAKEKKLGIWKYTFEEPSKFRKKAKKTKYPE